MRRLSVLFLLCVSTLCLHACGSDPVSSQTSTDTLVLSAADSKMTEIIGDFTGDGSAQTQNFGSDSVDGLGGAYDGSTIGRLLWHVDLPTAIQGRTILSAKASFVVRTWGNRSSHGQVFTYDAHRILRPWSEASATGLLASVGSSWNKPLVGFDGVDAEQTACGKDSIPDQALGTYGIDITSTVQKWASRPDSNFGLVFRSVHESDGTFLDYPSAYVNDVKTPAHQPRLIVVYR